MKPAPIPPHIAAIERPRSSLFHYYVLQSILATVAFPFVFPVLYFRFHTMRYRFDTDGIHMQWGIIFRREIMLNYARIQDIHLRSNLVERWLGLARIEIQTASGRSGAEMTLEGIEDPEAMRDFLYSRMRGTALQSAGQGATDGSDGASGPDPNTLPELLTAIATELRGLRVALEARGSTPATGQAGSDAAPDAGGPHA